jgi:hypothetical protein
MHSRNFFWAWRTDAQNKEIWFLLDRGVDFITCNIADRVIFIRAQHSKMLCSRTQAFLIGQVQEVAPNDVFFHLVPNEYNPGKCMKMPFLKREITHKFKVTLEQSNPGLVEENEGPLENNHSRC